jgi:hypothetical protein
MEEADVAQTETILEAHKASDGSLLAYICGLARGSGCETIEPNDSGSAFDVTAFSAILP